MKTDGHPGRDFLKGYRGDQANALLSAVGYNFRLILAWVRLLRLIPGTILERLTPPQRPKVAS